MPEVVAVGQRLVDAEQPVELGVELRLQRADRDMNSPSAVSYTS